jgi:agmatinase
MWTTSLYSQPRELNAAFLKLPYCEPKAEEIKAAGAKVAFYGMPWDMTSISRTGASFGPRGIREVSYQFLTYNATLDFDLVGRTHAVDCADTLVALANPEKTFARAQEDVSQIIAGGALPVIFGGDHSIPIPTLHALLEHYENPGLVIIDSHLDTGQDVGGELNNHACPIARAVDFGFDPSKIVLLGMNGWLNPRSELEYARDHSIAYFWAEDIWEKGTKDIVDRTLKIAGQGTDGIYLTCDVDAMDAAFAPATCVPGPGALTAREMLELVRGISSHGLLAFDVAETAPSLECTSQTAAMAAKLALDAVAYHFGSEQ